jgi:1,5-anhydro-D-fructose reductase (1,5-anhydro-D-mannitol-forming)
MGERCEDRGDADIWRRAVTVGWGIVSTAGIADESIAPAIAELEDTELVGVTSREHERAQEFASRHGARLATTSIDELLADPEIDIVYIATPNAAHAGEVIAAAAAGKHVYCEKPLATSVAAAEAAVEACREANVKLGVNFQTRHYPPCAEIREVVQSGALGDVLLAEAVIAPARIPLKGWRTDPQLAGFGTMNNLGVHVYDLVRYILGSEVVEATALLDVGRRDELETMALALLRFENGTLAYLLATQAVPHFRADVAFYGSEGKVVGRSVTRPEIEGGELTVVTGGEERVTPTSTVGGFKLAVAEFQRAVVSDEEPNASGLDGLRSADLTEAIARSAREGRTVEVRQR